MDSNRSKNRKRIEDLRKKRLSKSNIPPPPGGRKNRVRGKSRMKKDHLKEVPIDKNQYVYLWSYITKFTPQKSDYDGFIVHEMFPYIENPMSDKHLKERIEYWSGVHDVDVYCAMTRRWVPLNPRAKDIGMDQSSIMYKDKKLNETMVENIKARENTSTIFDEGVKRKMRKAYLESIMDAKKLGELKHYRSEEQDGPMTDEFWQDGDKALLEEIVEDKKKIISAKKRLGIKDKDVQIVQKKKPKMLVRKEDEDEDESGQYDVMVDDGEEEEDYDEDEDY